MLPHQYDMNKLAAYLMLFATVAGLSSCCKKRTFCTTEKLNIAFAGFDRSVIRTVILKRYAKGDDKRVKALDSAILINKNVVTSIPGKPDTSWLSNYSVSSGNYTEVQYGYDWVVYLSSNNKSYLVSEIYEGDNRYEKVPCGKNDTKCTNNIKSYAIDGFWVEGNTLYIKPKN